MPSLFLQAVAPIARIFPTVKKPERTPPLKMKLIWSIIAIILYTAMASTPIYGIERGAGVDVFWTLRVILASSRGTLAELGIGPIVTGGLILEILVGSRMINVDFSDPDDRKLFNEANKAMAIIMTVFESAVYIAGGAFGTLTTNQALLVFLQLVLAGIIIILLDEMVQKGWGLGSGISLFIVAGVALRVFHSLFSSVVDRDGLPHGFFWAMIEVAKSDERTFGELVLRYGAPDLVGLLSTIGITLIVIYMEMMTIEIPVESSIYRFKFSYPIKFMYSSNIPVILTGALFANIMFFSQLLWSRFEGNFFVALLGSWTVVEGRPIPTGGLAAVTVPPNGLLYAMEHPYRSIGYVILMILSCYFFALTWVEIGGTGPDIIAEQLISSRISISGVRMSKKEITDYLRRYIYPAAALSGVLIGLIAGIADVLGAYASGSGILLAVSILKNLADEVVMRHAEEIAPRLRKVLLGV